MGFAHGYLKNLNNNFNIFNSDLIEVWNLLHDPDSIKTGTKGRDEILEMDGILTGVDLARAAPTSIDSASI